MRGPGHTGAVRRAKKRSVTGTSASITMGIVSSSRKLLGIWLAAGGLFVAAFGFLGYSSTDAVMAGVASGTITGLLVLLAARWQYGWFPALVPTAEYLAAVWAFSYVTLIAITATLGSLNLADWIILSPPVGFLPLAMRKILGDNGDPMGSARSTAYHMHRVIGWLQTAIGCLAAISLFYLFVAPMQLVPGLLHLGAAQRYRVARTSSKPANGPPG